MHHWSAALAPGMPRCTRLTYARPSREARQSSFAGTTAPAEFELCELGAAPRDYTRYELQGRAPTECCAGPWSRAGRGER